MDENILEINNENNHQVINLDSAITENNIYIHGVENNIEKITPIINGNCQDIKSDNNSDHDENSIIKDHYMNINRYNSCSSNSSDNSNISSQSKDSNCNSYNSKTPINPKSKNESECDIIHGNFCSSDTIIDKGSTSNSLSNNNDKNKSQNDSIMFINEAFGLNEDLNLSLTLPNDNMTMTSNGSNNFNDIIREELEPTSIAWYSWKIWCLIKILLSLFIIMFGVRALIIDRNRTCSRNFIYISYIYNVIALIQIALNIALILYLPNKIYQINYAMHKRLCISKVLWGIQGFVDIFQLALIPIGIKILKGSSNTCFDKSNTYNSSTYNYIYNITLFSSCLYIIFVTLVLIVPCWTLFILLPKYEGVSMNKFRKINTIEVTKDLIEQDPFCVICMEQFILKSKIKQLPCKHVYHKKCISIWFAEHNKW
ncbi:hypothetical protein H8356DRAFT_1437192 [Neocallimastix lanati (nom. inval.)]|nr:hypothetical protein H8356DRAFT_1437192 [Neocallimastix sp. JGI-2020a]